MQTAMESSFWHERWAQGQIGFHLPHPHPLLIKYATRFAAGARVLVPLCGKASDLFWLAERGHLVVGVELSELAARTFFEEHKLPAEQSSIGAFTRFAGGDIEILCGDFFQLTPEHLARLHGKLPTALYDRAALIALPAPMRKRYAQHVVGLLPPAPATWSGLLITLEHAQRDAHNPPGPPFSVPRAEIEALYEPAIAVAELERADVLPSEPRFADRGIDALYEVAYALGRKS